MCRPFIGIALDSVGPEVSSISSCCQILHDAIAPVIGIGSPIGCLEHVTTYFHTLLARFQNHSLPRTFVENSIYDAFDLAGEREFDQLCRLPL